MRCKIKGCENELSDRSVLPICALCRNGIGRWLKRRPAEVIERRRKLGMYQDRFANLIEERNRRKK